MYDDVVVNGPTRLLPEEYQGRYQTKDLDCDGSEYRVDEIGQFLKVEYSPDGQELLLYSMNLNQDINCYDFGKSIILKVRYGNIASVDVDSDESGYWDGVDPVWQEFFSYQGIGENSNTQDSAWVFWPPALTMLLVSLVYKPLTPVQIAAVLVVAIPLGYLIRWYRKKRK
ncbi:hypothetical protein [Microbulbifer epialgicus]|uniref:Uncharacterized protein n=1 Tax=Microbulbifer epialgicus TaxID=393907 RepID=A0ABV4NU08_9GAMM